jgi:hypothetical protein
MQRRHTTCQWNGQAARLIRNKCRGRVAQRPYVTCSMPRGRIRLRSLAYVTCSMPRGSIGAPPKRGAGVYADRSGAHQSRSGHVSAPDPPWALSKALGPHCGLSGPHTGGGPDPILGVRSVHLGVLDRLGGPDCISRGRALSHGGSDSLLTP